MVYKFRIISDEVDDIVGIVGAGGACDPAGLVQRYYHVTALGGDLPAVHADDVALGDPVPDDGHAPVDDHPPLLDHPVRRAAGGHAGLADVLVETGAVHGPPRCLPSYLLRTVPARFISSSALAHPCSPGGSRSRHQGSGCTGTPRTRSSSHPITRTTTPTGTASRLPL